MTNTPKTNNTKHTRRTFLSAAALAAAAVATTSEASGQILQRMRERRQATDDQLPTRRRGPRQESAFGTIGPAPVCQRASARLRIASQIRGWIPGNNDAERMRQMKAWGMEAVEPGGGVANDHNRAREFKKMADDAGLNVCAVTWGADDGNAVSGNPEEVRRGVDNIKRALEGAAILESNGIVYVPAFNGHQQRINRTHQQIRQALIDIDPRTKEIRGGILPEVGEFAASLGVNVILEPLNRMEAMFLRQIADGAAICQDAQSEGIKVMGDFYHMFFEETCDMGAFISGGKYVKHVHLGSGVRRIMPGQDPEHSFVAGFRGLKFIGYNQYMSFECSVYGGDERGAEIVPQVIDFLRRTWDAA